MNAKLSIIVGFLILTAVMIVAPVGATGTGYAAITGNPPSTIDITVTGNFTMTLTPGINNTDSSNIKLTVSSNKIGWFVQVHDHQEDSKPDAGKMVEWDGSGYVTPVPKVLTDAMVMVGPAVPSKTIGGGAIPLTGSGKTIETGVAVVTSEEIPITIAQQVEYADAILTDPNVYRIVITFVGTPT